CRAMGTSVRFSCMVASWATIRSHPTRSTSGCTSAGSTAPRRRGSWWVGSTRPSITPLPPAGWPWSWRPRSTTRWRCSGWRRSGSARCGTPLPGH
ncbi:MAG: hypothetical protein AVDCRST_MAG75-689, partial [uncultured Propionibacteriaceae bacterium]